MKTFTATIDMVALGVVKAEVSKLEKRIKSKVVLTEGKPYWQNAGTMFSKYVMDVTLDIPEIEYVAPGYRVVGMVDFRKTLKGENGLVYVFDEDYACAVENYRSRESAHCDHCNKIRFRNVIYVLLHEVTGKIISVGRTCLKDFLHIDADPMRLFEKAAESLDSIRGIDVSIYPNYHYQRWFPVEVVLSLADYAIKKYGYVNRSKAIDLGTIATPVRIIEYLRGTADEMPANDCLNNRDELKKWFDDNAAKVFDDSNFGINMKTLLSQDAVKYESFGFLSYAIVAMNRYLNKSMDKSISQYVGKVKDKIESTLKVTGISAFATRFGESTLYRFVDENNNILILFSSKEIEAEKGKRYRISAIVKEHNEYRGVKQTILTRCKIVDKLDKEPEPKRVDSTGADKALDAFLCCCDGEASEEEFVNNLEGGKE